MNKLTRIDSSEDLAKLNFPDPTDNLGGELHEWIKPEGHCLYTSEVIEVQPDQEVEFHMAHESAWHVISLKIQTDISDDSKMPFDIGRILVKSPTIGLSLTSKIRQSFKVLVIFCAEPCPLATDSECTVCDGQDVNRNMN